MTALCVDQHCVNGHRIEFPLPPDIHAIAALTPADTIRALARLQHQALAAEPTRLLADNVHRIPAFGDDFWAHAQRQTPPFGEERIRQRFQLTAAFALRLAADVTALRVRADHRR